MSFSISRPGNPAAITGCNSVAVVDSGVLPLHAFLAELEALLRADRQAADRG